MRAELMISVENTAEGLKCLRIFETAIKKYGCFKYKKFNEPYYSQVADINRVCMTFVGCSQKTVRYKIISLKVNNNREAISDFLKAINFLAYISKEVCEVVPDTDDCFSISLKTTDTSQKRLQKIKWHIKNEKLFPFVQKEYYLLNLNSDNIQDKELINKLVGATDTIGYKTLLGSDVLELKERTGLDVTDLPFLSFVGKTSITIRKTSYQYYD